MASPTVPGEHEYDGDVFMEVFPRDILVRIKDNFQLRDDDILVTSYPKSGTTWDLEIVWLLMNGGDIDGAKSVSQDERVPFLELRMPQIKPDIIDMLEQAESPHIIKSHLAFNFFERELKKKKTKVVVGLRNVKDVLVSYYHFYRMNDCFGNYTGTFSEFFELFKEKRLVYGDWFDYVLSYWNKRHDFNFFFLKYEDLHKDLKGVIRKLAVFLGVSISDEILDKIAKHVSFREMKDNNMVNKTYYEEMRTEISPFMRKGKVGDWKNYLTDEMNEYVDEMYTLKIKGTGLEFDFEI